MELKTYRVIVNADDDLTGVYAVSLVDQPAIEVDWIKLGKVEEFLFSANADKQMLFGPLLIPNKLILRKSEDGEMFNIMFDAETIQIIADKYNENKINDIFNFQHSDKKVNAVLLQNWITGKNDKSQDYGFDLPEGTWFAGVKVKDENFWMNEVKTDKVKGFSIEVKADVELIKMSEIDSHLGGPGSGPNPGGGGGNEPTSSASSSIPTDGGVVTDKNEISKIMSEKSNSEKFPAFDKTPNDKIDGEPARIISSKELEDRVNIAMKTPTEIYNSKNNSKTPDALEYPDRNTAEKIAVMQTFGVWSDTPQNFINGEEMVKSGGVWYGSEKGKGKLFNKTAEADKNENIKLMDYKTKDGLTLRWDGEAAVGSEVFLVLEDGTAVAADNGTYELEDGTKIVIDEGKVGEIIAAEVEVEAAEVAPEHAAEMVELLSSIEELRGVIAELSSRLDKLENVETIEEETTSDENYRITELEAKLEKLSSSAGAASVTKKTDSEIKRQAQNDIMMEKISFFKKK